MAFHEHFKSAADEIFSIKSTQLQKFCTLEHLLFTVFHGHLLKVFTKVLYLQKFLVDKWLNNLSKKFH